MGLKNKAPAPAQTGAGTSKTSSSDQIVPDATQNVKGTKAKTKKPADTRQRNFATVVYPESAPADWQERLAQMHVAALISPLHDRDHNPSGELKKPHYHVMLMFDGKKSFDTQVKPIFDAIGGVGREEINSMRGYARYMCHLDNPEKAQYSTDSIIQMGGADYTAIVHLPTDDSKMLMELFRYIRANQIYSLAELIDICAINNIDWFNLITMSRAYIVDKYMKSLKWECDVAYERQSDRATVDPETGEIIDSGVQENGKLSDQ